MKTLLLSCAVLVPALPIASAIRAERTASAAEPIRVAAEPIRFAAERIRFAPAAGTKVTKTIENKAEMTLDDMSMKINGQPPPMQPEIEMTMTIGQKIVVTDEYVDLRDGAPKKLKRHYDELANDVTGSTKFEMMGQTQSSDQNQKGESDLEGKTVVFTWDEDESEYVKAFDPAEEKEDLLKDLEEDTDLRALLPTGDVKAGDEWSIDVKTLVSVVAPGGNHSIMSKEIADAQMGMSMAGMGSMSDFLGELLEGEAKGVFTGTREVDGVKLAAIKISFKLTTSKDMTEIVKEAMKNAPMPAEVGEIDFDHMDVDMKMESEGELLWDLTANHARSFSMSGPVTVKMDMGMKMDVQGQSMGFEQTMEMSGTSNMSATYE